MILSMPSRHDHPCTFPDSAGRTKAERRLRKELKALIKGQTDGGVNLKPIARIRSPFKGRCGTPRQGLLAPNCRYVCVGFWLARWGSDRSSVNAKHHHGGLSGSLHAVF